MAVVSGVGSATSFFNLPLAIQRLKANPIDKTEYWTSMVDAENYALTDPTAYIGQTLTVYENDEVGFYQIQPDGTLKEVGSDGSGVKVVESLPTVSENDEDWVNGQIVVNTADGRIYFLYNRSWIRILDVKDKVIQTVATLPSTVDYEVGQTVYAEDVKKMYFLTLGGTDGTTKVWKQVVTAEELENLGAGDMLKMTYDTDNDGIVEKADVATKLEHSISVKNVAGTTTKTFDGSADIAINAADLGALTSVPVATTSNVGGFLLSSTPADNEVSVNESTKKATVAKVAGITVNGAVAEASKTTNAIQFLNEKGEAVVTFDGSAAANISASDLGALTSVPNATADNVGLVKPGAGLDVDDGGTLTINTTTAPKASKTAFGLVKVGENIDVAEDGTISANIPDVQIATNSVAGVVSYDDNTIKKNANNQLYIESVDANLISGVVANATHAITADNYTDGAETKSIATEIKAIQSNIITVDNVKEALSGVEGGYAPLDAKKKISSEFLPSYVDDIIEGIWVSDTEFKVGETVIEPEAGKIYVDTTSNYEYRWSGSQYVNITDPLDYATTADATTFSGETATSNGTNVAQNLAVDAKVMTPARVAETVAAAPLNAANLFIKSGDTLILNCGNATL